jgi:hypothetical protein
MAIFGQKGVSVAQLLSTVVERVLGSAPEPVVDRKMLNLAQKQANIRAVSVRKGFQAIAARSDEMAQRIAQYNKQLGKNGAANETPAEPSEQAETIVLSSVDPTPPPARVVNG